MNNAFVRRTRFAMSLVVAFTICFATTAVAENFAIVIHGGAGTISKKSMTAEKEQLYKDTLKSALLSGHEKLKQGESAVNAVKATIIVMENSPLFNAGKGAVFSHEGKNELDASIMDGSNLNAGAIAGVTKVKNPILLADKVMTQSKHVMLTGYGAEQFAQTIGLEFVDPKYFYVERRWKQLQQRIKKEKAGKKEKDFTWLQNNFESKFGTVGAVALDKAGNIAAGTSTGGLTNKHFGRIGDSPIIGAGTYAENGVCGVSATGHGEYFIRAAVAHDICARVKYGKLSIQEAADEVVQEKLVEMEGQGGVVALGGNGDIAMSFNTSGMYRGAIDKSGKVVIKIYK